MSLYQFEVRECQAALEEAASLAHHGRVHEQSVLVYQLALVQRMHHRDAPGDHDLPALLRLELSDLLDERPPQEQTPRQPRWTNPIRTTTTEDNHTDPRVTSLRQLHTHDTTTLASTEDRWRITADWRGALEASAVLSAAVSVDVFVFLSRGTLPTTAQWQNALDRLGIDVQLDAGVEAGSHTGFWPARVAGRASGFEFFVGPISDVFGRASPAGLDERDFVADLVTHSDLSELQCSMFAAAALGVAADGLVFDNETEGLITPEQLLKQARAIDLT